MTKPLRRFQRVFEVLQRRNRLLSLSSLRCRLAVRRLASLCRFRRPLPLRLWLQYLSLPCQRRQCQQHWCCAVLVAVASGVRYHRLCCVLFCCEGSATSATTGECVQREVLHTSAALSRRCSVARHIKHFSNLAMDELQAIVGGVKPFTYESRLESAVPSAR